jgi:hypothetical protein
MSAHDPFRKSNFDFRGHAQLPPPRQYPFRTRSPPFGCVSNALTVKSLQANPFASKPEPKLSNMNRA